MTLKLYLDNKWIRPHDPSKSETDELLAIAERDISQAQTPGLGPEWRFGIAYNAALQLATATLAAEGFQADRQSKHQRTIECLEWTIGLKSEELAFLDLCRRKRHTNVYDQIGAVSDLEASELIQWTIEFQRREKTWLKSKHPRLMK